MKNYQEERTLLAAWLISLWAPVASGVAFVMGRTNVQLAVADMLELYCKACLVEPSYEEFKDIITDEQMFAIFDWGMDGIEDLENFREDEGDGSSNNNG